MFHSGMMIKLLVVSVQHIKTEQNEIINVTPSNMSFILSLVITILKKDAMIKWLNLSLFHCSSVSDLCHRVWSGSLACMFKVSPFLFIRRVTSSEKSNSNAYYNMFYKNNTQKETKSNNNLLYTYMMGDQQLLHTTTFQIDLF